jgi:hypothetical protein
MVKQHPISDKERFRCKECNKLCTSLGGLSRHILNQHKHIYKQLYYDKWLKENNEDLCKICGKKAIFKDFAYGYKTGCCKEHMNEWNYKQIKKAIKDKYGVDNIFQSNTAKEAIKKTCLKLYGCEHNHQNINVFEKSFKSGIKIKKFKDTNIWYQGSYELDFLEKYYAKFPDITRGPAIKYYMNEKTKVYFPDFYIPSLNLIIECKSDYYYHLRKEMNIEKKKATISNGFNYLMILDKNYSELL